MAVASLGTFSIVQHYSYAPAQGRGTARVGASQIQEPEGRDLRSNWLLKEAQG